MSDFEKECAIRAMQALVRKYGTVMLPEYIAKQALAIAKEMAKAR